MINRRTLLVGGCTALGAVGVSPTSMAGPRADSGWRIAMKKRENCSFLIEARRDFMKELTQQNTADRMTQLMNCPLCRQQIMVEATRDAAA
jgi:hypothetical protein